MKRRAAVRLALWLMALAAAIPWLYIGAAESQARMTIQAGVAVEGIPVAEGYTLRMRAADAAFPMPAGSRDGVFDLVLPGAGSAAFPQIVFTRPGNYAYAISQLPGSHAMALAYDATVYDLRIQVFEKDGGLQLTAVMNRRGSDRKAAGADFFNRYVAPAIVTHNPPVKKKITGDTPGATATFRFSMKALSNTAGLREMPMPQGAVNGVKTVSATAKQETEFGEMTFNAPGSYVYQISEVDDGQEGYSYDRGIYTLVYTVTRQGEALACDRSITKDGKAAEAFVFTNTYASKAKATATAKSRGGDGSGSSPASTPAPTVEIAGQKVWEDDGNAHGVRPARVTVRLYANDAPVNDAVATWSGWRYSFGAQPAVDEAGQTITYTVKEDPVPYYSSSVNGTTITNTLERRDPSGYTSVSGAKTWIDGGAGRPGAITVRLLRDGEPIAQQAVTAATDWRYRFDRLPLDDGYGHTYLYSVREDGVAGYFARYRGYDIENARLTAGIGDAAQTPDGAPEDRPLRPPAFWAMTEEELQNLINLYNYRAPSWGRLFGTGDETPAYPFVFGGIGLLALSALWIVRRRRRG